MCAVPDKLLWYQSQLPRDKGPPGTVAGERRLYRHPTRAGYRIGDGKHVDLLRHTAWLVSVRHEPKPERKSVRKAALSTLGRASRNLSYKAAFFGARGGSRKPQRWQR